MDHTPNYAYARQDIINTNEFGTAQSKDFLSILVNVVKKSAPPKLEKRSYDIPSTELQYYSHSKFLNTSASPFGNARLFDLSILESGEASDSSKSGLYWWGDSNSSSPLADDCEERRLFHYDLPYFKVQDKVVRKMNLLRVASVRLESLSRRLGLAADTIYVLKETVCEKEAITLVGDIANISVSVQNAREKGLFCAWPPSYVSWLPSPSPSPNSEQQYQSTRRDYHNEREKTCYDCQYNFRKFEEQKSIEFKTMLVVVVVISAIVIIIVTLIGVCRELKFKRNCRRRDAELQQQLGGGDEEEELPAYAWLPPSYTEAVSSGQQEESTPESDNNNQESPPLASNSLITENFGVQIDIPTPSGTVNEEPLDPHTPPQSPTEDQVDVQDSSNPPPSPT